MQKLRQHRWCVFALAGLIVAGAAAAMPQEVAERATDESAPAVELPALRAELLAMRDEDQRLRALVMTASQPGESGKIQFTGDGADVLEKMNEVDRANTARLREIVEAHGWPTISMVGDDGSHAAWLLVQHATEDRAFMERVLAMMEELVGSGEVSKRNYAYLWDRVQMQNDRLQRYGTQFTQIMLDGEWRIGPWPIENPEGVDALRKSIGLGPLAEYRRRLGDSMPQLPDDITIEEIREAQRTQSR